MSVFLRWQLLIASVRFFIILHQSLIQSAKFSLVTKVQQRKRVNCITFQKLYFSLPAKKLMRQKKNGRRNVWNWSGITLPLLFHVVLAKPDPQSGNDVTKICSRFFLCVKFLTFQNFRFFNIFFSKERENNPSRTRSSKQNMKKDLLQICELHKQQTVFCPCWFSLPF